MLSLLLCCCAAVTRRELRRAVTKELFKLQLAPMMNPALQQKLNTDRDKLAELFQSAHDENFYENADEEFAELTRGQSEKQIQKFMKKTAKDTAKKYAKSNNNNVLQLLLLNKLIGKKNDRRRHRSY